MREERYTTADPFESSESSEQTERGAAVLRLLRGRWHWAILLAVILGTAGTFLGYNITEKKYQAVSTIDIKPGHYLAINFQDPSIYEPYLNFISAERRKLSSLEVISDAMTRTEWTEAMAQRPANLSPVTVDTFTTNLSIDGPGKNESVLYIQYSDTDPATARAGVNALLASYREVYSQDRAQELDENLRLLQNQLRELEKEKAEAERQIKLIIPGEEMVTINSRLNSKLGELANMQFRLSEIELELKPYLDASKNPDAGGEKLIQSPEMTALLQEKKRLEENYVYLTEVLKRGPEMLDVVQVSRALTMVDRKIVELEKQTLLLDPEENAAVQYPPQVAALMSRREGLIAKIQQLTTETNDLAGIISSADDYKVKLAGVVQGIRETEAKITEYKNSLGLSRNDDISRIVIGPQAQTPTIPFNTRQRVQFASLGLFAGVGIGFGLVMLVGLSDRRLRHAYDTLEGMSQTSVLGVLPTLPAKLTNPEDAETAAHCVHHIRTLLQIGGSNRVFSITSPVAGSGKSSLATALGMSFAASGVRTLLIDCDLVGAGLSRRMGTLVHDSLDKVIRRNKLINEADLSRLMTKAASSGKPLEQVLRDEKAMTPEQIEGLLRLQKDTSLGLLDACGPGKLRPPVTMSSRSDDLYILLDEDESSMAADLSSHSDHGMIEFRSISDHGRLHECVGSTDIKNLFILPVGKARPADASRLSPAAVRELIRQARESYDIVLIDTGPVLGSLEASIVSAEADATILIVARGDHKSLANRMIAQLRSVRANIVGIVFNHAVESDLSHMSYTSAMSQERRAGRSTNKKRMDQIASARLGPLGTAVASHTEEPIQNSGDSIDQG